MSAPDDWMMAIRRPEGQCLVLLLVYARAGVIVPLPQLFMPTESFHGPEDNYR
jgi:hypothetical protein